MLGAFAPFGMTGRYARVTERARGSFEVCRAAEKNLTVKCHFNDIL